MSSIKLILTVHVLMMAEKPSVEKMMAEYLKGLRLRTRKGQSTPLQGKGKIHGSLPGLR